MSANRRRLTLALLALLPVLAHAPAWWDGLLVGPGDGAALHYPMKLAVWRAWRAGELPGWNPAAFGGTPLLGAYRPAALHPLVVALAPLDPFVAFQALVLFSLSSSALLTYVYLRRLHAEPVGAYAAGLCFALGPYLVGHLDDTATLLAAPTLPLLLLAAEWHVDRSSPGRVAGLALVLALNLLSGSPEGARAGLALLVARLCIAHLLPGSRRPPPWRASLLAVLAGVALSGPQLVPTLLQAREAGRQATGFANLQPDGPAGLAGLIFRYAAHTPAAALAVAALPLILQLTPVRVLAGALAIALGLQWGHGPLSAPGALALVFDLALCVLAGLSLSEQWRLRLQPAGRRLRAYLLLACLASAAALSLAAATLGALPQSLAGAVGVQAIAQILFFATLTSRRTVIAGVWLLPLSASLLLQPHARTVWRGAPTRALLEDGSATWRAVAREQASAQDERVLTLVRTWPHGEEADLGYAAWGGLGHGGSVNGYDPMVPLRARLAFDGMGPAGLLPGAFFRSDPTRLELLAVRWLQVPASALSVPVDRDGLGEGLDMVVRAGQPRAFPLPIGLVSEVRVGSLLSEAVELENLTPVARVRVRLASGREIELLLRAGRETAEWAYDRPDVRASVRHARAPLLDSWTEPGAAFRGHSYLAALPLQGRYLVSGLTVERLPGPGLLTISRLGVSDGAAGMSRGVSLASALVSDGRHFRESVETPGVRLYELPRAGLRARVASEIKSLPSEADVLRVLRAPAAHGLGPGAALTSSGSGERPAPARRAATRVVVSRAEPGHWELRAEGPGLLVVADGWDPGWSALLDERPAAVLRTNHVQLGVALGPGLHRVELRYRPVGLALGMLLAGAGALGLLAHASRRV